MPPPHVSRRRALVAAALVVASACRPSPERATPATRSQPDEDGGLEGGRRQGEIALERGPREGAAARPGLRRLGLGAARDGLVYIPTGYRRDVAAPLAVMLHGAGGRAERGIRPFLREADRRGLILLAPESRGRTWDVLLGGYGPDVRFIERAMQQTLARYSVDRARLALEGFSDGASYALSLGMTNGDVFSSIIAFSPGFAAPARQEGSPAMFVSHGTQDRVLRIGSTSRTIVPRLRRAGYEVRYVEFDGGHEVPTSIVRAALTWWLGGSAP